MRRRSPAGPALPRHTPVSDLIPLLHVEEDHFVATDGRYGRVLACTGVNLAIQGDEAAEGTVGRFGEALAYLPPDAHLQLVVLNRPLRGPTGSRRTWRSTIPRRASPTTCGRCGRPTGASWLAATSRTCASTRC